MPETEPWSRDIEPEEPWSRPVAAGESPNDPIDTSHPDVSIGTRQLINWAGGDPKTGERYLQGQGFDAKAIGGFNFAVKRPEEKVWQRLDSTKWEWQDVLDVAGDVLSLGGMVTGGLVGSPGGIVGGVAGSAAGAAGMQGVRSTIGQMLGMPATQEEVVKSLGTEAVMGATAEVGGRILGGIVGGVARKIRGKPPAAPAPAPAAGPKLAAGETAATREEIMAGIGKLGSEEKFGVEFVEKLPGQTTRGAAGVGARGAGGKTRRTFGEYQKEPPQSGEIRRWADEWAELEAGKAGTVFEGKSKEQVGEELYRRMLHGEIPAVGPGRAGPYVDVAKREAQLMEMNPPLVKTVGTEITAAAKVPKGPGGAKLWHKTATPEMKKFIQNTAIPHPARELMQRIIMAGPKGFEKNLANIDDFLALAAKKGKPQRQAIDDFLADAGVHPWAKDAMKLAIKETPEEAAKWSAKVSKQLDMASILGSGPAKSLLKQPGTPSWVKSYLKSAMKKDPMDAANFADDIAGLLKARLASTGGIAPQQAQGWAKQARNIVESWAKKLTAPPTKRQVVSPLGDPYWQVVPTGSDVAFWRDLPIDGIQKLFNPDGSVLVLTAPQAKAAKVIVQSAATDNWTPWAKKQLKRLIDGLKWPKRRIIDILGTVTNAHVMKFVRKHPIGSNVALGVAETMVGGTAGGLPGGAAIMDIAGRGIERVFRRLLTDTSGKALTGLFGRSTLGVPEALKKAAQAAGAGNEELYRAIMWTALKQTDVNEYLQAVAGSRGVNASGPRVRSGHGS